MIIPLLTKRFKSYSYWLDLGPSYGSRYHDWIKVTIKEPILHLDNYRIIRTKTHNGVIDFHRKWMIRALIHGQK